MRLARPGWLVLFPMIAGCADPGSGRGTEAAHPPDSAIANDLPTVGRPRTRVTPTFESVFSTTATEPAQFLAGEREFYYSLLEFDMAGADQQHPCGNDEDCDDTQRPDVNVYLIPEKGSHRIGMRNVYKGWRVVAKLALRDPTKRWDHGRLKLDRDHPVAYWWIGPRSPTSQYISSVVMIAGRDDYAIALHDLMYYEDEPWDTPSAAWKHRHTDASKWKYFERPPAPGAATTTPIAAPRDWHWTWFGCDAGCCSSGGIGRDAPSGPVADSTSTVPKE